MGYKLLGMAVWKGGKFFLRRRYGANASLKLISPARGLFGRKVPGVGAGMLSLAGERAAAAGIGALSEIAEEKALWARYGR